MRLNHCGLDEHCTNPAAILNSSAKVSGPDRLMSVDLSALVLTYCSEVLIEVNLVFSLVPRPFTTAMMASEMPAAIRPYSMAVAPVSSAKDARSMLVISGGNH
jgi:hypothetical protein